MRLRFGCRKNDSVKLVRAHKQYLYSEDNQEYLDLSTTTAHVGHCHPVVVSASQEQLKKLTTGHSARSCLQQKFENVIAPYLPNNLKCYYMLNSGSEANDLALLMARRQSGGDHFIVFKGAYHGSFTSILEISPKAWKLLKWKQPAHTHVVNPPDIFRGPYRDDLSDACDKYVQEVSDTVDEIHRKGGKVAAFISEPVVTACGVIVPPKKYYKRVYQIIRRAGGVVIADETGCSLGRAGDFLWTFEHFDVVPDIVTVGKSLGNGFPVSLLVTSKDIANRLGEHFSTYGGNPVACAVSSAVFDVIEGEMVKASCRCVGKYLLEELGRLRNTYVAVGDVRGLGLCIGVEIVRDDSSRDPRPELAQHLSTKLLERGFLVGVGGPDENVLILTPPLCMTQLNVRQLTATLDDILKTCSDLRSSHAMSDEDDLSLQNPKKKAKLMT